jgi:RNA recognition motif-containing protein
LLAVPYDIQSNSSFFSTNQNSIMGKQENSIFVGGISWKATEDDLKKCFGQFGEVVDVKIVTDKFNNNQSKGFGFIEFKDEETCDKVKKLAYVELLGKNMNISSAVRGSKDKKVQPMPFYPIYYAPQTQQQFYQQMIPQNQQFFPNQKQNYPLHDRAST